MTAESPRAQQPPPDAGSALSDDEQRAMVFEFLRRREQIAAETRAQLAERDHDGALDPLGAIDPRVRAEAEDAYFLQQGKRRYRTSDGRTLFLTPEEIAQRRRTRSQQARKGRRPRYYGPGTADRKRWYLGWGFNAGVVALGLVVVWLILH